MSYRRKAKMYLRSKVRNANRSGITVKNSGAIEHAVNCKDIFKLLSASVKTLLTAIIGWTAAARLSGIKHRERIKWGDNHFFPKQCAICKKYIKELCSVPITSTCAIHNDVKNACPWFLSKATSKAWAPDKSAHRKLIQEPNPLSKNKQISENESLIRTQCITSASVIDIIWTRSYDVTQVSSTDEYLIDWFQYLQESI